MSISKVVSLWTQFNPVHAENWSLVTLIFALNLQCVLPRVVLSLSPCLFLPWTNPSNMHYCPLPNISVLYHVHQICVPTAQFAFYVSLTHSAICAGHRKLLKWCHGPFWPRPVGYCLFVHYLLWSDTYTYTAFIICITCNVIGYIPPCTKSEP